MRSRPTPRSPSQRLRRRSFATFTSPSPGESAVTSRSRRASGCFLSRGAPPNARSEPGGPRWRQSAPGRRFSWSGGGSVGSWGGDGVGAAIPAEGSDRRPDCGGLGLSPSGRGRTRTLRPAATLSRPPSSRPHPVAGPRDWGTRDQGGGPCPGIAGLAAGMSEKSCPGAPTAAEGGWLARSSGNS